MPNSARLHRRLISAVIAVILALTPALATAEAEPPPAIAEDELADLVALVLGELGLPADATGPIVDEVLSGVTERLNELVEQGVVDPEDVDDFTGAVEAGDFDDVVASVVEEARERRDAFREAAESVLTALGIEVPEDGSLKDAIEEAGLTREELAELFEEAGIDLPAPPTRPERDGCDAGTGDDCPERPAERAPARPAPAPTTTTQAPAPAEPPAPEPTPPAPDYPDVTPQPSDPDYPTRGGKDERPAPPPRPEYPTAGDEPDAQADESV